MEYLQDAETEEAISEEMRLWRLRSMMRESANLTRQDFRCPKRGMMEGKIYEIRFDVGQTEYDYEILASDGQVISSDIDSSREASAGNAGTGAQSTTQTDGTGQSTAQDDAAQQNTEQAGNAQNQQSGAANNAEVAVSLEEASAIALEKVPGATENDLRIELDYDDGRYRYEGDIIYQQVEYDFEINADTGEVIEWSEERG